MVVARELTEKISFVLAGKYQTSSGSEIRLEAMNIPRGSVVVTAGGATLVENVDYTVDYTMGVVTILNQSILASVRRWMCRSKINRSLIHNAKRWLVRIWNIN